MKGASAETRAGLVIMDGGQVDGLTSSRDSIGQVRDGNQCGKTAWAPEADTEGKALVHLV